MSLRRSDIHQYIGVYLWDWRDSVAKSELLIKIKRVINIKL
jgi:hypothetical protein